MADYFVDTDTTTDSGSGTLADPWGAVSGNAWQRALDLISANSSGDVIHTKGAAAVNLGGVELDFSSYGSPSGDKPVLFSAYESAAWDSGRASVNVGASTTIDNVTGVSFRNLDFSGNSGGYVIDGNQFVCLDNCSIDCGGGAGLDISNYGQVRNCHIYNFEENYAISASTGTLVRSCVFDRSSNSNAICTGGPGVVYERNIFIDRAISASRRMCFAGDGVVFRNNTFWSETANISQAIEVAAAYEGVVIDNNYFEGWNGSGATPIKINSGGTANVYQGNRFFNCNGNSLAGRVVIERNNTTTVVSGLVDAANGDFSPTEELIGVGSSNAFLPYPNSNGDGVLSTVGAVRPATKSSVQNRGILTGGGM